MVSLRLTAALLLTVVATPGLPSVFGASEAGTSAPVGFVSRVQNEASVLSGGKAILAIAGTPVAMKNELRTGAEARLEVTFNDGTVLTLGERANMIVDSFVYDPGNGSGEAILRATEGAFRFLTGKIKELEGRRIAVVTPVAEIGVRGTEFWGGPIDAVYGVLLLQGEVAVSTQAGSVVLSQPGEGTHIASPLGAPASPAPWDGLAIARAVATVSFR
ncbi:MAG TPA: FecR family protein [Methyloceanibacter sp.]|nr:FecR family protein [Methyloceanibacter sp.]